MLVIEDDPTIAELLGEIAVDIGMQAHVVADASDVGDDVVPDLIVTDLVVADAERPEDGIRYLRRLRERFMNVPLLLVTARLWPKTAPQLPVDAFIGKPFDLELLTARMVALAQRAAPLN